MPRVTLEATAAGQTPPQLDDLDVLLGVSDATRQGALRFATDDNGPLHHPSTLDGDDLSVAKFPHPADEWNVIAWEKTALDLVAGWAHTAGVHGISRAEIARFAPAFEAASAALSR